MSAEEFFHVSEFAHGDGYRCSESPTEAPSTESSDSEDAGDFVVTWDRRRGTLEGESRRGGRVPSKRLRCLSVFEKDEKKRKRNAAGLCVDPEREAYHLDLRGGGDRPRGGSIDSDDMEDYSGLSSRRHSSKILEVRPTTCKCCDLALIDETAACVAWKCGCEPAANLTHGDECPVCSSLDLSDVPLLA
ncbi:hypothetical protein NCLIV_029220 [Neospora caninum Liverpool]|uniref:Uncharacterized protein n=1 Tax=Neospora caninum (strain Liverpool) TaxID=572307 RepID=F0VHE0_NEOCL|nr:hypothetical protein NCLIV_029220 [Neospora caninum Liverpool]CBZ53134.1 hypothetical protein NCLIV_029220 [Neospora caninum Liverpool]CEL67125.1 TPA: hypothetical protein BN1204_029220 [Neospora caninum Liverpool]|eukprot:XP_003883166.1 hypothetical protein NCLIV_029220 [Neospora caninum Liverpool]